MIQFVANSRTKTRAFRCHRYLVNFSLMILVLMVLMVLVLTDFLYQR